MSLKKKSPSTYIQSFILIRFLKNHLPISTERIRVSFKIPDNFQYDFKIFRYIYYLAMSYILITNLLGILECLQLIKIQSVQKISLLIKSFINLFSNIYSQLGFHSLIARSIFPIMSMYVILK